MFEAVVGVFFLVEHVCPFCVLKCAVFEHDVQKIILGSN